MWIQWIIWGAFRRAVSKWLHSQWEILCDAFLILLVLGLTFLCFNGKSWHSILRNVVWYFSPGIYACNFSSCQHVDCSRLENLISFLLSNKIWLYFITLLLKSTRTLFQKQTKILSVNVNNTRWRNRRKLFLFYFITWRWHMPHLSELPSGTGDWFSWEL